MTSPNVDTTISFLHTLGQLKDTPRTGWVEQGIPSVESVSDHMYRMAVLCMMCPDTTLNKDQMIRMALCHDMAEAIVGDISPAMNVSKKEKFKMELDAITAMTGMVSTGNEMHELWQMYESQRTPEAHFVRDMDLLEMVFQAHYYEQKTKKNLHSFFVSGEKIKHPWAKSLFARLKETRAEVK